jgi:phytoene dehydrogenase-like protein
MRADPLYEADFYAWTQQQARELRRFARGRSNLPLDLRHIAEEIADLGKNQRDTLRSWTANIIEHLLLLEHSPAREPRAGWIAEIVTWRRDIDRRLSGTLRRDLARQRPILYQEVRSDLPTKLAAYGEAHIAERFPEHCPYSLEQVLGDFWPDPA